MKKAKGDKGKCDDLFSQQIRSVGRCQRCGSTRALQCAHIVGRVYSNTRIDPRNAWCLCAGCHQFLDGNPWEKVQYAHATIGEAVYAELREKANSTTKVNWKAELERLRGLARTP